TRRLAVEGESKRARASRDCNCLHFRTEIGISVIKGGGGYRCSATAGGRYLRNVGSGKSAAENNGVVRPNLAYDDGAPDAADRRQAIKSRFYRPCARVERQRPGGLAVKCQPERARGAGHSNGLNLRRPAEG